MKKSVEALMKKIPLEKYVLELAIFPLYLLGIVTALMLAPIFDYLFLKSPYLVFSSFSLEFKTSTLIFLYFYLTAFMDV